MYLLYNHKGAERGFVVSKSLGLNIWETTSKSMIPSQIEEVRKWSVSNLKVTEYTIYAQSRLSIVN